jgi:hypothetical protein
MNNVSKGHMGSTALDSGLSTNGLKKEKEKRG